MLCFLQEYFEQLKVSMDVKDSSNYMAIKMHYFLRVYTLKNKGASKVLHSDAIEEPFLVPQRTIQSKVL